MDGVRLPSPVLKKYFPNMLSNTFSDMGVTDHRQYDR